MRFSLGSGSLYISKNVCKQICPVWPQGRKDCFFLLFLIFVDEQPLLPAVVLPAYIFGTPPAAVPSPAV